MSQQKKTQYVVLVIAAAITITLFFVDILYGAMGIIVMAALFMSFRIMGETAHFPDVVASLPENARGIILINRGNDTAQDIHVTLVPHNMEYNLPILDADATHTFPLPKMIDKVKVVISYKNRDGKLVSRNYHLSALKEGSGEEDLLKPAFPMFGWK